MKKYIFTIVIFVLLTVGCVVLPGPLAFAQEIKVYDIEVSVYDATGNTYTGGTLSYSTFPQTIYVTTATPGVSDKITVTITTPSGATKTAKKFTVNSVSETGTYVVTATSANGAQREIAVQVKYEVKAQTTSTYRYRTVGIMIDSIKKDNKVIKSNVATSVGLVNGTTLETAALTTVEKLVSASDGATYTLVGSMILEVYTSSKVVGRYVVSKDWNRLLNDYEWVPATIDAFQTMCSATVIYQAPKEVKMGSEWRDTTNGNKILGKIEGKVTLYPYQWAQVSAYINDNRVGDKYNHISSGLITIQADGKTVVEQYAKKVKITYTCNTGLNGVTALFNFEKVATIDIALSPEEDLSYPENEDVVTWIYLKVMGEDLVPGHGVEAVIRIPELGYLYETTVVCMENSTIRIPFAWHTPEVDSTKQLNVTATVNGDKVLSESDYSNNSLEFTVQVRNMSFATPTEQGEAYPSVPYRTSTGRVEWTEQTYINGQIVVNSYYAELKVDAKTHYTTKEQGYIRSGYGYTMELTYTINTNYHRDKLITDCQMAYCALPQYTYHKPLYLERKDVRTWHFAMNDNSPDGMRKQYVPVWWEDDKEYVIQAMCGEVYTPGGMLCVWVTGTGNPELKLNIEGSMYDDDHIGY